jgi:hypothetical protein
MYLQIKIPNIPISIFVKVFDETNKYYLIKKNSLLNISGGLHLTVKNKPDYIKIHKTNISKRCDIVLIKIHNKPPPVENYRIYD